MSMLFFGKKKKYILLNRMQILPDEALGFVILGFLFRVWIPSFFIARGLGT